MEIEIKAYIERINLEIKNHMADAIEDGFSRQSQCDLHVLFKNRKHALEMIAENEVAVK